MLDADFGRVGSELKKLANENMYSGEVGDQVSKRLDKTMSAVPCGLPVLPPHWIFTVNVWTYEIVGKYQVFSVIDNDNEVIPEPYFGHKGQKYVREKKSITLNGNYLGENKPITFKFNGYASSVVGPGPKGVGDKLEGTTEESAGYQTLSLENGG